MKMTLQNFRRTADTNGAAANVVNAFNRFGESLANGINGVVGAYTAAKQSEIDNANATRQFDIAQQNADANTKSVAVQSQKVAGELAAARRKAEQIERYLKSQEVKPTASQTTTRATSPLAAANLQKPNSVLTNTPAKISLPTTNATANYYNVGQFDNTTGSVLNAPALGGTKPIKLELPTLK